MVVMLATLPASVGGVGKGCEDAHVDAKCNFRTIQYVKCFVVAEAEACGVVVVVMRKNERA